ncbi:MAG: hypothetical protein IJH93_00990 [Lachnospiraceae bacterium]|nr:hypothetical protein [Lachnospiraceae bacterium]
MNGTAGIYQLRERLILFYKKQEYLLVPVFRFAVSLALLLLLRAHLGVHGPAGGALESTLLNVIIALVCSMLPPGFAAAVISLVMVWDLYRLSLEATALCAALLLLCLLVYFRFSPPDTMVLLIMPIAYALNLHYAVPVFAGLLFGPGTAVPVVFGLIFTRYVLLVEESLPAMGSTAAGAALTGERLISNFRGLIDGMMGDRGLIILAAALAVTAVVVCFIRHLVMANAWTAAITVGCVLELLILLIGDMRFDTNIDLGRVFAGIVISFLLAQVFRFFAFNVDYLRIESTQFEDEDYYYYVKAVPKVMVPIPSMSVTNINEQTERTAIRKNGEED